MVSTSAVHFTRTKHTSTFCYDLRPNLTMLLTRSCSSSFVIAHLAGLTNVGLLHVAYRNSYDRDLMFTA